MYASGPARFEEPNHRQQMALERIEFAVNELASVLISTCRAHGVAQSAIREIRRAVTPIVSDVLTID
jgi:hypothetical protein